MKKSKQQLLNEIMTASSSLDAYIEQAGRRFCERIDFEVLSTTFVESGWHRVAVPCHDEREAQAIWDWVYNDSNIKGKSHGLEGDWVFESASDANWFIMRWSTESQ